MKIKELFPYLCVRETAKAITFYQEAFGAKEKFRLTDPSGRIGHAEVDFGSGCLMLSDEFPEYGILARKSTDPVSFQLHIHVDNADEFIARALKLGAEIVHETKDQFYGERSGTIRDPFGLQWNIGHQLEELTPKQMQERYEAMMKSGGM